MQNKSTKRGYSVTWELQNQEASQLRAGIQLPKNCKNKKQVNERSVCRYLRIAEIKNKSKTTEANQKQIKVIKAIRNNSETNQKQIEKIKINWNSLKIPKSKNKNNSIKEKLMIFF